MKPIEKGLYLAKYIYPNSFDSFISLTGKKNSYWWQCCICDKTGSTRISRIHKKISKEIHGLTHDTRSRTCIKQPDMHHVLYQSKTILYCFS